MERRLVFSSVWGVVAIVLVVVMAGAMVTVAVVGDGELLNVCVGGFGFVTAWDF